MHIIHGQVHVLASGSMLEHTCEVGPEKRKVYNLMMLEQHL